jgi:hypothetical protein
MKNFTLTELKGRYVLKKNDPERMFLTQYYRSWSEVLEIIINRKGKITKRNEIASRNHLYLNVRLRVL